MAESLVSISPTLFLFLFLSLALSLLRIVDASVFGIGLLSAG